MRNYGRSYFADTLELLYRSRLSFDIHSSIESTTSQLLGKAWMKNKN
jgi:hypothetical protein